MFKKIILASGNAGKLKELKARMPSTVELCSQADFNLESADETGLTFIENAILKARHASKESGLPALADDSGIVIDHLKGAPGIYSARYAGNAQANIEKVLQQLQGVEQAKRQAHFHCTLVLLRHANDPDPIIASANWQGEITTKPQGDNGFGYDPILFLPSHQCTAAQLPVEVKNKISHRGQALTILFEKIAEIDSVH